MAAIMQGITNNQASIELRVRGPPRPAPHKGAPGAAIPHEWSWCEYQQLAIQTIRVAEILPGTQTVPAAHNRPISLQFCYSPQDARSPSLLGAIHVTGHAFADS